MKFLKQNGWAAWIGFWLAYLGFGVITWQFWACIFPLIVLVGISRTSLNKEEEEKKLNVPKPVKKDLDYFR